MICMLISRLIKLMNPMLKKRPLTTVVCLMIIALQCGTLMAQKAGHHPKDNYSAYLFTYFTGGGKGEEAIRFALSDDGYHFKALNRNNAIINPAEISSTGGLRDPHILRGKDGRTFYMVATDMNTSKYNWGPDSAMVLMKSADLISWTSVVINIPKTFPEFSGVNRVWAPQTIYDQKKGKYMIYWSMRTGEDADKIYYSYVNKDFTALETVPKQLFFSPTNGAAIDGDIVVKGGKFYLFLKTVDAHTGIRVAVSDKLTEGYVLQDGAAQQTKDPVEGAGVFKLNHSDEYILMYDLYTKGKYQFTRTKDLKNFRVIDNEMTMDFHPRHGTVMPVTAEEAKRLRKQWMPAATVTHNPVLKGYFADPEVLYAQQTGKFYIYPTSDGFDNWGGTYFKSFSSPDLVNWKDEGVILDLGKDVSWAKRNAWAPCIVEKKIDGVYQYFYYYSAAQKIGVAVADHPTGPFRDSGKALIDKFPAGVSRGQQIDPDVFTDPTTGKSYLYWGNGYMAGVQLNEDMISFNPAAVQVITPDKTFREGTYVFYRNGKYYFMWSENDTRSENYRIRYGTSEQPLGKITVPANNLVLEKKVTEGIYGTGHNSVIQVPGKDEWYMVYHRFNYPKGITMGDAAGYNREVCIDQMEFNSDGSIKPVIPTHEGIRPVKLR